MIYFYDDRAGTDGRAAATAGVLSFLPVAFVTDDIVAVKDAVEAERTVFYRTVYGTQTAFLSVFILCRDKALIFQSKGFSVRFRSWFFSLFARKHGFKHARISVRIQC